MLVIGVAGKELTAQERDWLRDDACAGVILFKRNFASKAQVAELSAAIREASPRPVLVCVDQEGGRVQRFEDGYSALPALDGVGRLYAQDIDVESMRAEKQREIAAFRTRYARARDDEWQGDARHDAWVAAPINNARLVPFGVYGQWVPAFAQLFHATGSRWPAFHACVGSLARMTRAEREPLLGALLRHIPETLATRDGRGGLAARHGAQLLREVLAGGGETPLKALVSAFNERVHPECRRGSGYVRDVLRRDPRIRKTSPGRYALPEGFQADLPIHLWKPAHKS